MHNSHLGKFSFRLYFPFRIGHQLAATRRTSRETTTKADAALPALRWVGPSYCKRANTNPNLPCLHQSFRAMAQISGECPDVYLPSSFITIPDYSTKFSPTDFFSSAATTVTFLLVLRLPPEYIGTSAHRTTCFMLITSASSSWSSHVTIDIDKNYCVHGKYCKNHIYNPRVLVDRLYNEMVLWRCPIPIRWL